MSNQKQTTRLHEHVGLTTSDLQSCSLLHVHSSSHYEGHIKSQTNNQLSNSTCAPSFPGGAHVTSPCRCKILQECNAMHYAYSACAHFSAQLHHIRLGHPEATDSGCTATNITSTCPNTLVRSAGLTGHTTTATTGSQIWDGSSEHHLNGHQAQASIPTQAQTDCATIHNTTRLLCRATTVQNQQAAPLVCRCPGRVDDLMVPCQGLSVMMPGAYRAETLPAWADL